MTSSEISFDRSRAWARRQTTSGALPVAVFGAASSRGIQHVEAFGTDNGRIAQVDDQFALFSVTKPLTALAAMKLVENGELSLEAPLSNGVPRLSGTPAGALTLQQLLSHTSGLSDPPLDGEDPRTTIQYAGTEFPAGTMTQYCNLAFIGVEKIMESASSASFESQFASLNTVDGVGHIGFDGDRNPHVVHGTEAVRLDHPRLVATRHPAAGAFATASDLLALGSALLRTVASGSSEIVAPRTLSAMRVNRTTGLPRLNGDAAAAGREDWGLGFNLPQSSALIETNVFGHEGWSGCQWWIYPQLDACFVLMTNLLDLPANGVRINELQNAFVTDLA